MRDRVLHPAIVHRPTGQTQFQGGTLSCRCTDRPVRVKITGGIAHNHACGCTKCWKPNGAAFSIVAVAPTEAVTVAENGDKLAVVDPAALIQRFACDDCGTHMHGPVERDHAFKGLTFIHPELFDTDNWPQPGFAAFVSSVIESGVHPSEMDGIRSKLEGIGLAPYDCLSPALMDYLATWAAKKSGVLAD